MTEQVKEKLEHLPDAPGVYKMLDGKGEIIYIGKSKCLKKRVKSYFVESPKWDKVYRMAPFIKDIDYVVTDTHLEAMLLECELIKQIRPYFNVLMKYDDRYVYLKIGREYPDKLLSVAGHREDNCFGPFRSRSTLLEIIDFMKNIYPVEKIKRTYHLTYHIFPKPLTRENWVDTQQALLGFCMKESIRNQFLREAEKKMGKAAQAEKYETAVFYRDLIQYLKYLKKGIDSYDHWMKCHVLLNLETDGGRKLFYIVKGRVIHKKAILQAEPSVKEEFRKESQELLLQLTDNLDHKGNIDYCDIIYGEMRGQPSEKIEIEFL
ncbi:GIY-YIG nuclease family protein [uncultured Robinsoniella sp.]|uniref:GIY-YIG nuclease family protein n=1 Tax=uncultured Robinsoniella sp. TaxID=904190 RepID=UPI00374E2533